MAGFAPATSASVLRHMGCLTKPDARRIRRLCNPLFREIPALSAALRGLSVYTGCTPHRTSGAILAVLVIGSEARADVAGVLLFTNDDDIPMQDG